MFHVHFSNRFAPLADLLVSHVARPRGDVFAADEIVVPGSAMRQALTLAIADRESVCANVRFSYLARWLWTQVARVVQDVREETPFDPDTLAWRIYAAFGDDEFVRRHARLSSYLAAARTDEVMRYELAARTASLLEQYVTYRPDWLVRWQRGEAIAGLGPDEAWQAELWRRIAQQLALGRQHPVQAMAQQLAAGGRGLPREVHVFGLPTVPPLYLEGLQALGRHMDVHVYAFNPCREFWYDVVDLKTLARLEAQGKEQGYEEGNRLLASWGKQAQASLALVEGICHGEGTDASSHYEPAGGRTLLAQVQDAVLELRPLDPGALHKDRHDRSIEVHVCHSLTRELEVLHDHLLGRFADDPSLEPQDILVVTPRLEDAAPLVDAVFGTVPDERRIPYRLTGRARSSVNAPVRAFVDLLALVSSRCPATAVFALLQQPVVARRFGLDEPGLQHVRDWLLASGTHWALDADHVESLGLPHLAGHSLADGLERLYLGYALPDEVLEPFFARLPAGSPEGSEAVALGVFRRYAHELTLLRRQLWHARTAAEWVTYLQSVVETFIDVRRDEAEDLLELTSALDALAASVGEAGFDGPIAAPVIRAALERAFDDPAMGGVPTGRVTFAALPSLRNIPFKVVCAIGMNDGVFPTPDRPAEFDLMTEAPRLGDRQRGTDQRTLFLDLVLAAGESLYISYTGRSIRDNSPLPPSVLVSELLEAVGHADEIVVEHPLQPFSPRAFGAAADDRLRSFDAELAAALRASLEGAVATQPGTVDEEGEEEEPPSEPALPFFPQLLQPPGEEWREVSVHQLVEFFANPSRYLLSRRLGIDVPRDEEELQDNEPFLPDFRASGNLAQRLLPLLLQGMDFEQARVLAQAGTELPPGAIGDAQREAELAGLALFARRVRAATEGDALPPREWKVALAIEGEAWTVRSDVADLRRDGLVRWRYTDAGPYEVLDAGIRHLLLCAGSPTAVRHLLRDGTLLFDPIPSDEAKAALGTLVGHYRAGLRGPLPFALRTSWDFLKKSASAARTRWEGSEFSHGDSQNPAHRLVHRGRPNVVDQAGFAELAEAVFGAMRYRETGEGIA